MQKVAVTGDWCHTLPVYPHDLCSAHLGQSVNGQTQGDDIAIEMRHLAEAFEGPDIDVYWCHNEQDALQNELSEFTPFTCEAVGQSDWRSRRQHAKKQGKMKLGKAAGRERKAVMCKASQTSWLSDDTYVK